MKICQVGTGFLPVSPTVTGGAEKYVFYLSAALQAMGHEVTLIDTVHSPRPNASFSLIEAPTRWHLDSNLLAHAIRGLLFGRTAARRLDLLLREKRFHVVNFHNQFSALAGIPVARRHGVPAVFTVHNPLWSDAIACRSRLARAKFWMERRAQARADAILCVSHAAANNLFQHFSVDPSKLWAIPVGVDQYWFEDRKVWSSIRKRYTPDGGPLVLHVGRIAQYKNQLTLARSFPLILQAVPNAHLAFAGPVDSPSYLKQMQAVLASTKAGKRVVFTGPIPFEEMSQLYALAQVVVMPSIRENCPQAALETMAQARAMVGSDIPPMRELLSDGEGVTVPAMDHDGLAHAVVNVLQDAGLRRRLGTQARRRAHETYRWEVVAQKIADHYARLSGARQAARPSPSGA